MSKTRYYIIAKCYNKRGVLIGMGTNDYKKSHPLQAYFAKRVGHPERIFLHAEIAAILAARSTKIYEIRVERYDAGGQPVSAKPCPICAEAIKAFGIKRVSYT